MAEDIISPSVPAMLHQLEHAYQHLLAHLPASKADTQRLLTVLADFQWYSERLGSARWEHAPRPARWSFAENLWHITEQAVAATQPPNDQPLRYFIDHGKEHVGQAAEIIAIIAYDQGIVL